MAEAQLEDSQKALTNWKNAPTVLDLKKDFQEAKPIHDAQVSRIEEWLDNLNITGKAKVKTPDNSSRVVPKLIRKQAEWRYPALSEPFLSMDDLFNVRPVTWEDKAAADQNALLLNHQFSVDIKRVNFIDEFVRAAVDEGTVILRTGWEYEEEVVKEVIPVFNFAPTRDPAVLQQLQQYAQLQQENPNGWNSLPPEWQQATQQSIQAGVALEPVPAGSQEVEKVNVLTNHPTVEVCDFHNVIIDPTCSGDISKASFVIYSFESSKAKLKKDKRYKHVDLIDSNTNSILGEPDHASDTGTRNFQFSDDPRKKFVVYEYWGFWDIDGTGKVKPIVAAWVGDTLIRMEENPYPDKALPFIVAQYLPVRKHTHGEPDGELLADNQAIMGAVTRGMIDILGKSANGQTGMRKDMLDATNRRKWEQGRDYEFNPGVDPRQGVYMHTMAEIPQSAQFLLMQQNEEAESITGVKSYAQGISGESLGAVASLGRGALDAASKRELNILRRLANAIIEVGKKFISMNAVFLSEEEVVRVTNDQFVTVRRDELAGKFDLRLSISTAEEDNAKAQELAFILQTMGNTADPGLANIVLSEIVKLRKMPDLAKRIAEFRPQPDPLAIKQRELEIALLEAKLENEKAKAVESSSNAQLNTARVGTEQARAENLSADTDQKNLNFVEQESGVKQERDLQKQGEQARSQARLKLMDLAVKSKQQNA
jgi:hypothetical protein